MSDNSDEADEPTIKRKRGMRNTSSYKRNKVRDAIVKGLGYVSHTGKVVPGKAIPQDLICKCSLKCHSKINNEHKKQIWDNFYSLDSKNTQDVYLQTLINRINVNKRTTERRNEVHQEHSDIEEEDLRHEPNEPNFKRNNTFIYQIRIDGKLITVCRNIFLKLHGVSTDRIKRICKLLTVNKTPVDKRGKKRSANAIPGNLCILIHEHISSFDVKETHYGGRPKKYLDARLNVKLMHEMFMKKHPELGNLVKYNFYYMYFKENFNLSFGRPQVDVCCECEGLKSKLRDPHLSDGAKRNVAAELMIHQRRAKKFYLSMKSAAENKDDDTFAFCFDYMQNLPLPNIPVQEVFYMRQLWVNVFGIHNLKTNEAKMYMYHEGQAYKSPDEVCSFLFNYIKNEIPDNIKHLILFSDGPFGQNKNHTVIRFLLSLCDNSFFETITYNFPVRGHSYSPCDRDFGTIKRIIRKVDRIYTPTEYAELILRSSTKGRFKVYEVNTEDILNFSKWWSKYYKKMTASDETSGRNVPRQDKLMLKISTYKQFIFRSSEQGKVEVRQFIDSPLSSTFTLKKWTQPPEMPIDKAYPQGKVSLLIYHNNFFIVWDRKYSRLILI